MEKGFFLKRGFFARGKKHLRFCPPIDQATNPSQILPFQHGQHLLGWLTS